ncbi:MAG TPA: Npt1/Npt2 family nucleotide transporter [Thermoanaerobaculia bacterium]|nr:Npt1/Npt2 family nucleotide transporter [Thermoanaerobaculia bacterium]
MEPDEASQPPGHGVSGILRRALSRFGVHFRGGEAGPAILLFFTFFLLITFQYTTKSVRQSTFINSLGAERLPYVYLFVALASYPFLRIYSRFADSMRRDALIIATCTFTGTTMIAFWWLFEYPWPWVPFAFYVWISITFVMMVSQFWSFSSHVFDPRQARRLFAFIGAGGLLGGVMGGQVAKFATKLVGTRYALLVAAMILFALVALIWLTRRMHAIDDRRVAGAAGLAPLDEARGGFQLLRQSRHLKSIAAIMVLTVVVAQIVDLQFNWAVQLSTTSLDQRTAFFGNFYSVIGVVAFAFQLIFTARIHRSLGVGFAMRVLPVSMAVGTIAIIGAAAGAPEMILGAALLLKSGENGLRYSLDQATRELLFLPIPSRARVKAKAFIDVFVQRGAKGLAALLLLPVTFGLLTPPQVGWLSLALIGVWLATTVVTRRHYVESFRAGLKQKGVIAGAVDLNDATALELVVQSLGSTDAHHVIHALRLLQKNNRAKLVPPLLLYHDSAPVRRATLRMLAAAERHDALPLVERCLSDTDAGVRVEAVAAVAALRKTDAASLMAPYLDSNEASLVSAAVVAIHNHGDDAMKRRAGRALAELLADDDANARAEAAKAFGQTTMPGETAALTLLLADRDPGVVRAAIGAVRRRVLAQGPSPMYVASLISLLDDRRLKHDARQALIAFGERVIPALLHFMNSPDERMWVRRAIPKTMAMIGGPAAVAALAGSLRAASDPFLRRKLIDGLGIATPSALEPHDREIAAAIAAESASYFRALAALTGLGSIAHARMTGPLVVWDQEEYAPTLLDRLLSERMADTVDNLFAILALAGDRRHVRDAHLSITSGQPGIVGNAVEYLDNTLAPAVKRFVLPVVEDHPLDERLQAARALFSIEVGSRLEVLGQLVEESFAQDGDGSGWGAAALYEVYASRAARLYPAVDRVRSSDRADPLSRETAEWIARRIDIVVVT